MKIEQQNLLKAIQQLVNAGNTILQVKDLFEDDLFFVVFNFEPSEFNTAASVDYHVLKGINITEFLDKNINLYSNPTVLVANFDKTVDECQIINMEISKGCRWCKYSK